MEHDNNDIPSEASDLYPSQETASEFSDTSAASVTSAASTTSAKNSINGVQKDYFVKLLAKFIR